MPVIFVELSPTMFPFAFMFPVKVETPETAKLSNSVCPSTSKLPSASILPVKVAVPDTFNEVSVPTLVNEELTTPEPRVVAFRTDVLLILYDLPDAIFKCSDDAKLSPVASN